MVTQKFAYIVQGMRLSVASPSNWHNQRSINGMEGEAEPSHVVQTMLRNLWDSTLVRHSKGESRSKQIGHAAEPPLKARTGTGEYDGRRRDHKADRL